MTNTESKIVIEYCPLFKGLVTVIKEVQLRFVFLMPDFAAANRSCLPPFSLLAVNFCTIPLGRVSVDFWAIGVSPFQPLTVCTLNTEETG